MCIPVIVLLLYLPGDGCRIAAGIMFILASLTDYLDGHIARKHNLVTDFGKFIDPVADKLLVLTTLIMLLHRRQMEAWIIIVILSRELAVDGLRMVAVGQGKVILIIACILLNMHVYAAWYMIVMTVIVVLMTLLSAVDYFTKNKSVFSSM